MKAVFLDIDGVVITGRSMFAKVGPQRTPEIKEFLQMIENHSVYVRHQFEMVDPVSVALINRIIRKIDMLILSSTHRKFLDDDTTEFGSEEHLSRLRKYLSCMGFFVPPLFSITPDYYGSEKRGVEVRDWLNSLNTPDIDDYIIIDDDSDFLPGQPLIKTDDMNGFSFKNYQESCKVLGITEV